MNEQRTHFRCFDWRSFGLWVGLTLIAFYLVVGFHFPTGYGSTTFDPSAVDLGSGLIGFSFGAVSGVIIGSLQWVVLRSWAPYIRLWIPFNALGFGLVHAWGDAVPYLPPVILGGGIVVGVTQYFALRHVLKKPPLWIPITAIAWATGFLLGLVLPHRQGSYNLPVVAVVFALSTGLGLRLLFIEDLPIPAGYQQTPLLPRWSERDLPGKIRYLLLIVAALAAMVLFAVLAFGLG